MAIGFQICKRTRKVDAGIVAKFRELPVANVSDNMSRMTAGGARLRPIHGGGVLAGPAFTVKTRPGDNLMVHKAIDIADPGDVIVVDGGGDLTNSLIGEMMTSHAEQARHRRHDHLRLDPRLRHAACRHLPGVRRRRHPSRAL